MNKNRFYYSFFYFFFQLSKLTIPMLKDYCRDKKLKASGTKKQDFIDVIQIHLGIAQQNIQINQLEHFIVMYMQTFLLLYLISKKKQRLFFVVKNNNVCQIWLKNILIANFFCFFFIRADAHLFIVLADQAQLTLVRIRRMNNVFLFSFFLLLTHIHDVNLVQKQHESTPKKANDEKGEGERNREKGEGRRKKRYEQSGFDPFSITSICFFIISSFGRDFIYLYTCVIPHILFALLVFLLACYNTSNSDLKHVESYQIIYRISTYCNRWTMGIGR